MINSYPINGTLNKRVFAFCLRPSRPKAQVVYLMFSFVQLLTLPFSLSASFFILKMLFPAIAFPLNLSSFFFSLTFSLVASISSSAFVPLSC
jgi:hypothetical protein